MSTPTKTEVANGVKLVASIVTLLLMAITLPFLKGYMIRMETFIENQQELNKDVHARLKVLEHESQRGSRYTREEALEQRRIDEHNIAVVVKEMNHLKIELRSISDAVLVLEQYHRENLK